MKIDFKKILTPGTILLALSVLLGLIGLILYGVNVSAAGYFHGMSVSSIVLAGIFALLFGVAAIASGLFTFKGNVDKAVSGLRSVLTILVPVLFMVCLMAFITSRAYGISVLLFSNADVVAENSTPENMASVGVAITGIVFFLIATLSGIVGNFFRFIRKDSKPVEETAQEA